MSRAVATARKGEYRTAALGVFVDAINLFEERTGYVLPKRYRCSCCGHEAHAFQHVLSSTRVAWNSACPRCDSRSRHRGLAVLLPRVLAEHAPANVLHFAPEAVLRQCFARPGLIYETADLHLRDVTHTGIDVQRMPFSSGSYGLVVCNHVLEHVADDAAALAELARILAPPGVAVISVPGDFSRRQTMYFMGELPNGHYRDYGSDFVARLEAVFSRVRAIDMHDLDRDGDGMSRGIRSGDYAFICERDAV